jgi:hypothetical protein
MCSPSKLIVIKTEIYFEQGGLETLPYVNNLRSHPSAEGGEG